MIACLTIILFTSTGLNNKANPCSNLHVLRPQNEHDALARKFSLSDADRCSRVSRSGSILKTFLDTTQRCFTSPKSTPPLSPDPDSTQLSVLTLPEEPKNIIRKSPASPRTGNQFLDELKRTVKKNDSAILGKTTLAADNSNVSFVGTQGI
ncbi:hypothetical protein Ciccas_009391 [Cichlidogyrus casuarinus]|uniref:Uncharacterized protein n=1 Tax=Cichlidogyrus casuarinus TaxID=1844966 RepID=A0ABD2PXE1_9PLAT